MKPEVLKYLEDIRISIEAIERYTADLKDAVDFENDEETLDSVDRRLSIIGEAMVKINKLDPAITITDKDKIIKLRHIIVHHYDLVTHSAIWTIVQDDLPVLKQEVQSLLA